MTPSPGWAALRLALAGLTLAAVAVQLARHLAAGFAVTTFVGYFTILSNTLAGGVLLVGAVHAFAGRASSARFEAVRGAAVVFMTVVGMVYVALLRGLPLEGLLPWVNAVHHYVMPVAVVAEWALRPPGVRLGRSWMLGTLAAPLVYLVVTLVRGAATGWYPYPFLDPDGAGGSGAVGATVVGIVVLFALAALAVRALGARGAA